jgi:rubredoxin/uncharacterized membrane protein
MKKWRCLVCGYVHEGDEPPDECPICGADSSQFELIAEANDKAPRTPQSRTTSEIRPVLKWRCIVCGYVHEGPEPPEECPVCGADKSQFEPIEDDDAVTPASDIPPPPPDPSPQKDTTAPDPPPASSGPASSVRGIFQRIWDHPLWTGTVADLAIKHHVHPISVHIPNGTLPIAVIMILISGIWNVRSVGEAAFYNMIFILLSMPVVVTSGILFWRRRYGGRLNRLFKIKLTCGSIVLATSLFSVCWHMASPDLSVHPSLGYILLHLVMLTAAGVAGYYGGRLVFHKKGS